MARMMFLIPLILSLTVHEWAHAWSAWMLGDDFKPAERRPPEHITYWDGWKSS